MPILIRTRILVRLLVLTQTLTLMLILILKLVLKLIIIVMPPSLIHTRHDDDTTIVAVHATLTRRTTRSQTHNKNKDRICSSHRAWAMPRLHPRAMRRRPPHTAYADTIQNKCMYNLCVPTREVIDNIECDMQQGKALAGAQASDRLGERCLWRQSRLSPTRSDDGRPRSPLQPLAQRPTADLRRPWHAMVEPRSRSSFSSSLFHAQWPKPASWFRSAREV